MIEDKEILIRFRNAGAKEREEVFTLLLAKYQQRLYWLIRRMVPDHDDTDDLLQEVFLKVWKNLDRFREDSQLYTWLYRIASNECITFLKKRKQHTYVPYDEVSSQAESRSGSMDSLNGEQISAKLHAAISTLPDKQRLVFNLKYFEEMKYEEMSEVLGTSVGALKASYHIAVKKIEEILRNSLL